MTQTPKCPLRGRSLAAWRKKMAFVYRSEEAEDLAPHATERGVLSRIEQLRSAAQ